MESDHVSLYLQLFHCDWLPPVLFSRILMRAGSLDILLTSNDDELTRFGLVQTQIERLRRLALTTASQKVNDDLRWGERNGNTIICFEDEGYPKLLRQIDAAPPLLFVRGQIQVLSKQQLAIVGSRKASNYGLRNAYWMGYELGTAGLCITSGLALGIDTRAHLGALASGNQTIAVVGTGLDIVYPKANQKLAEQIVEHGAVISEFPLGTPPLSGNFPRRNRIMSGMSIGTLVVEASLKSGTLITAKLALEQNREVFAIPGPINIPQTAGCHQLISEGARLVSSPDDVLEEFGIEKTDPKENEEKTQTNHIAMQAEKGVESRQSGSIKKLIGYEGSDLQYLLNATGLEYQTLINSLLQLELAGEINCIGGRYFRA